MTKAPGLDHLGDGAGVDEGDGGLAEQEHEPLPLLQHHVGGAPHEVGGDAVGDPGQRRPPSRARWPWRRSRALPEANGAVRSWFFQTWNG